jgi:hypothetical protein
MRKSRFTESQIVAILNGWFIAFVRLFFRAETMTLKIRLVADKRGRRICLSGQLRSEHLDELKSEVERGGARVTLDLGELDLVDVEGVRFLNACELAGVSILHCSPYIREWMLQERSQPKDHPELE